jgi:hypothetical protein
MEQKLVSVKHTRSSTARECDLCSFLPRRGTPARSLCVPNTGLRIDFNRWPNKYLSNLTWLHTRRSILQIETVSEDRFHSRAQLALWWYHRLPASHFHGNAETDSSLFSNFNTPFVPVQSLLPFEIWTDAPWYFSTSNNNQEHICWLLHDFTHNQSPT